MEKRTIPILVGTGGWDHEAFDRCFYPDAGMPSNAKLNFYSRYFDTVEVRPTFWDETLADADAGEWVAAVAENKRFRFNVKLHASFTHRKSIKPDVTRNVRALLQEMARHERLGTLLLQFPFSFTCTSSHRYHVVKLSEIFEGFPMHVEFRHESWNQPGLSGFLDEHSLRVVNADFPRIRRLMPFTTGVHGDSVYVRLHGRNEQGWLKNGPDTRYDYLYNSREVREIVRRVDIASLRCKRVTVVCNNTTGGKAIANAFRFSSAVHKGKRVPVPPQTLAAFPELADMAVAGTEDELLIGEDGYRRAM